MPSPFPGMDPFLEVPALWPSFHRGLISLLWMELNRLLPSRYVAGMNERIYMTASPKAMYPDAIIVKPTAKGKRGATKGIAVLECDPPLDIAFPPEEARESFLEIHLAADPGILVAVIEILSPANKTKGQDSREKYQEKQTMLLASATHLVEIDLLRGGEHSVALPRERLPDGTWDYVVCLHRGGWGNRFHAWPVPLPDRLPRFAVPLLDGDADLVVDLQSLVDRCYEAGQFERRLDYRQKCPPPLTKKRAAWIDQVLREKKLRK
jgi:hypothetical protein